MVDNNNSIPHLEVIDRVKNIPVVHSAIEKTESTYTYLKDSNHLINWALNHAEAGLHYATATAVPLTVPLAKKFEEQISVVDQKLCEGLNIVEEKMPIVKQPPQQVNMIEIVIGDKISRIYGKIYTYCIRQDFKK